MSFGLNDFSDINLHIGVDAACVFYKFFYTPVCILFMVGSQMIPVGSVFKTGVRALMFRYLFIAVVNLYQSRGVKHLHPLADIFTVYTVAMGIFPLFYMPVLLNGQYSLFLRPVSDQIEFAQCHTFNLFEL